MLQELCNELVPPERAGRVQPSCNATRTGTDLQNSKMIRLEKRLSARGIRLTAQRRAVLAAIEAFPQCRNVGMIHRRASKLDRRIHRVTVYRTLALLKRHGMLFEETGGFACSRHGLCENQAMCDRLRIKCLQCGKIIEMGNSLLDDLTRCVERDCQFRVARAKLDIDGYCQSCRT